MSPPGVREIQDQGIGPGAAGTDLAEQPPQPLDEPRAAFNPGLGPRQVALGRAVGQHEPADRVGAVGRDDLVGIDHPFALVLTRPDDCTEHTRANLQTYVNALSASGNTYHDIGMLWGARFISPRGGGVSRKITSAADRKRLREIIDEQGLRRYVNVYLNDEDVRFLGGLDTVVADGDSVTILPAVAGG